MSKLTSLLWSKIKTLGILLLFRDKNIFYKPFYGSLDYFRIAIFNIYNPGRFLTRIRYKRFPVSNSAVPVPDNSLIIKPLEVPPSDLVDLTAGTIRRHGAAVVDGFFSEDYLDEFRKKHSNFFPPPSDGSSDAPEVFSSETMSLDIQDLWMHEFILKVIQSYIGRLPYARNYPNVCEIRPRHKITSRDHTSQNFTKNPLSSYFAEDWHVDHSCLIQATVFFDDVVLDGSHMEILSGTNRMPCSSFELSHEYVEKSRWASRKLPCIGRKGSIQFHCGNVYHHLNAKPLHSRCWLKFEFTSGPNILTTPEGISSLLAGSSNYEDLTPDRKQILSGLIPPIQPKGYKPYRGGFIPVSYKGL